jgi:O-antigen ligase
VNKALIRNISGFLLVGAIFNDALLIDGATMTSLAKILFVIGTVLALVSGVKLGVLRKYETVIFLYAIGLVIAQLLSGGPGITDLSTAVSLSLAIGLISYLIYTRSGLDGGVVFKIFLTWIFVSLIFAYIQSFAGVLYVTDRIFESSYIPGLLRANGLMSDPNYFALICLIGACISLANKQYICTLTIVSGIVLSGSRSGLLVLSMLPAVYYYAKNPSLRRLFMMALAMIGVLLTLFVFRDFLPYGLSMIFSPDSYTQGASRSSTLDRMLAIHAALTAFDNAPFFGFGLGNLVLHPENIHGQVSHNTFIELTAESGMIGLLLYFAIYAMLLKIIVSHCKIQLGTNGKINPNTIAVICIVYCFTAMSLTLVLHYSRIIFFILSIVTIVAKPLPHLASANQRRINNS